MKFETYLPVFTGFYETIWGYDYDLISEDYNVDDIIDKIDNEQYEKDIIIEICNKLPEFYDGIIKGIELQQINYPKYYNFSNNSADILIDIDIKKLQKYMKNNLEKFDKYIRERYTSYDGFISHYSNDFNIWVNKTKNFTDFSINGHYLGSILDFIWYNMENEHLDLYYKVKDCISEYEYIND